MESFLFTQKSFVIKLTIIKSCLGTVTTHTPHLHTTYYLLLKCLGGNKVHFCGFKLFLCIKHSKNVLVNNYLNNFCTSFL